MALSTRLIQKQTQSLVMTPQLSQSIKLLQLSNLELAAFVDQEVERNPLLERDPRTDGGATEQREQNRDESAAATSGEDSKPGDWMQGELEVSARSMAEKLGTGLENVFPDDPGNMSAYDDIRTARERGDRTAAMPGVNVPGGNGAASGGEAYDLEAFIAERPTLKSHLESQLHVAGAEPAVSFIASDIIDNLDSAGYLPVPLEDIAQRLGASIDQVTAAHDLVRSFEPTGIAARDLADCLKMQLRERDRLDPAMLTIVDNLGLLAKRDFAALGKLSGLETADLMDALREIQSLDPKPGSAFETAPMQAVVPDIFLREAPDGSWNIELNSETLPRVLINREYYAKVTGTVRSEKDKSFLVDCLQTANWLTKSLDQRAQTILKVATEIVVQQDAFFAQGVRNLRPLTLKTVADAINMHESSVSRVTTNKYMMTPRGVFELKYFFNAAIASSLDGEAHSSTAVQDRIRTLIDAETAKTVLSDDAIVNALRDEGVDIARRTIAKYRDAMNIPSSVQRRREKRAMVSAT